MNRLPPTRPDRRRFLAQTLALGTSAALAPAVIASERARPLLPCGVMSGDTSADTAVIWSKSDRPARMHVELADNAAFRRARRIDGGLATADNDYTARVLLSDLPAGEQLFYRVTFADAASPRVVSMPATGSLRVPPRARTTVSFTFSGDEAGQGWGINPDIGGYRLYESMRRMRPDFFIHSGDQIYADGIIVPTVTTDDGRTWRNLTTEAKAHVAQSLDDFRGNFAYNFLDDNKRRFTTEVPFLVQWDDHEVRNNWFPGQVIDDPAYARDRERATDVLARWSRQAMFEYNPMRPDPKDPARIYRHFDYGPSLEVFMLDERAYRGRNTANRQGARDADSAFLGQAQLDWLKQRLRASRATWKVIATDMPLGLVIADMNKDVPPGTFEAWANGDDGAPLGRELELASLLEFIKLTDIRNVVWVTADVHYAAAHHYSPERARFTAFKPFWEFVAGPINAGTFGPNALDATFGPEVRFSSLPAGFKLNRSPLDGMQYFGHGHVDGDSQVLTMSLHDIDGRELYKVALTPEG